MNEEDGKLYTERFQEYLAEKDKNFYRVTDLLGKNIDHLRQFNSTLLSVDVVLIAAVFTALASNARVIQSPVLAGFGTAILVANAIFIVFLTDAVLTNENENLTERLRFNERTFGGALDLLQSFVEAGKNFSDYLKSELKKMQVFAAEEKNLNKDSIFTRTQFLTAINYTFIAALLLLVASLL